LRHVRTEQSWLTITTDRHVLAAAAMLTVLGRYPVALKFWPTQARRAFGQVNAGE